MLSEQYPKEFEKCTEILPMATYGVSSLKELQEAQSKIHHLEELKRIGLTNEEINLYHENEAGIANKTHKVQSDALKSRLQAIYQKIKKWQSSTESTSKECEPSTSSTSDETLGKTQNEPNTTYPPGHPMNDLKTLEQDLFGHLQGPEIASLTKRRKILRRMERKKHRILNSNNAFLPCLTVEEKDAESRKLGSLWDVRELVHRPAKKREEIFGPKKRTMYTVKNNKIVRLEPVQESDGSNNAYEAVDIVLPVNEAEERLLEGTKMSIDDIKKIERFKDYEPGVPSKVLYLKNIAPSVTAEQLGVLFNQFVLSNGGAVDVRLMTGRMRGQAFVAFQNEESAISALEEVNGTILSGKPIIAQFGRNSNRIQDDD